jgi:peptide/nickel transport system permease protein
MSDARLRTAGVLAVAAEAAERLPGRVEAGPSAGHWRSAFSRLRRNRAALAGALIVLAVAVLAIAAPLIAPYDPIRVNVSEAHQLPTPQHILGTDQFGRDIFSRLLYGGQLSLRIGLVSVGIASACGVGLGLLAGYLAGWVGTVIMRAMDMLLALPGILLALVIVAILGPSLINLMIAVGISNIPHYTRIVRANVLTVKSTPYVDAARVIGCGDLRIMLQHILPNTLASLIVMATLGVASAILTGAGLSFLGLGVQPPTPEWGAMLSSGRDFLRNSWWITTFPGLTIMITVLAINLVGDGLRDALDPRLKLRGG